MSYESRSLRKPLNSETASGVVQIHCRCPTQCPEWCRYPAGVLPIVRSGAGTPQVPCPVSEVVQIHCRCPAQCQEWCRYPADALPIVRSGAGTPQVPCPVSEVEQERNQRIRIFMRFCDSVAQIVETGEYLMTIRSSIVLSCILTGVRGFAEIGLLNL